MRKTIGCNVVLARSRHAILEYGELSISRRRGRCTGSDVLPERAWAGGKRVFHAAAPERFAKMSQRRNVRLNLGTAFQDIDADIQAMDVAAGVDLTNSVSCRRCPSEIANLASDYLSARHASA